MIWIRFKKPPFVWENNKDRIRKTRNTIGTTQGLHMTRPNAFNWDLMGAKGGKTRDMIWPNGVLTLNSRSRDYSTLAFQDLNTACEVLVVVQG
jgi:hypothetical protein